MIISSQINFLQLLYNVELLNLLFSVGDDRYTKQDCIDAIQHSQIYTVYSGDILCGFYTVDEGTDDSVEIHSYILPDKRRYSLNILRHIEKTFRCPITTSVYGTHTHVFRFLTRLGFVHTKTLEKVLLKDGETHDLFFLRLERRP